MSLERVAGRLTRRDRGDGAAARPVSLGIARLGPGWRVLHEVSVGEDYPAISHLVIGPIGVFSLLVRRHPVWRRQLVPERVLINIAGDDFSVDGRSMPYIPQARVQAWRAAQALSRATGEAIHVRPAVVVAGCEEITFHTVPGRVDVLARRHVERWLSAFSGEASVAVPHIYSAARRPEVWKSR
ncbi:MAG: hypothetical protein ACT4QF_20805 [Sporichthyaceae bacterium]